MTGEKKGPATVRRPLPELKKERDSFVQTFFKKGAQFTQELVNENSRLRSRVGELEQETAKLRAQVASDDAMRELLKKIERSREAEASSCRVTKRPKPRPRAGSISTPRWRGARQFRQPLRGELPAPRFAQLSHHGQANQRAARAAGRRATLSRSTSPSPTARPLSPIVSEGMGKPRAIPIDPDDGGIGEIFSTGVPLIEKGDLSVGRFEQPGRAGPHQDGR